VAYHLKLDQVELISSEKEKQLNDYGEFIIDRLDAFLKSIQSCAIKSAGENVKKIVGFGPGLTPSVDDFLAGLMSGLYYLSYYYKLNHNQVDKMNQMLALSTIGKTTVISEQMIQNAANGQVSNHYRNLLLALHFRIDLKVEAIVKANLDYGETSGTDFMLGVYMINKMLMSKGAREVYNGHDE